MSPFQFSFYLEFILSLFVFSVQAILRTVQNISTEFVTYFSRDLSASRYSEILILIYFFYNLHEPQLAFE